MTLRGFGNRKTTVKRQASGMRVPSQFANKHLGDTIPKTTETRTRLIALLHAMGQHKEAAQLEAAQPEL